MAEHGGGAVVSSNSIPLVDIRLLSQSELYSLSLCSPISFSCDDVVIPKIDRSVFNESAGSRKQTYSRLRLAAPSSAAAPRRRAPHLRPGTISNNANHSDPENSHIVVLLKQLFVSGTNPSQLVPVQVDYSTSSLVTVPVAKVEEYIPPPSTSLVTVPVVKVEEYIPPPPSVGQKRKRGRPRKNEVLHAVDVDGNLVVGLASQDVEVKEREVSGKSVEVGVVGADDNVVGTNVVVPLRNAEDIDKEVLNRDGVAVDLVALGAVEHPFWEEIRVRGQGLETAEELLGFLEGLNGQWGSRRKKKRIVDASEFGNVLPIGWKLLLSVKKKNGRMWLYCRSYISPSGRQFVSCKEVSSYLLSLHNVQVTNPPGSTQQTDAHTLTSVTVEETANQDDSRKEILVSSPSSPPFTDTAGNIILNAGDFPEEKVGEILHCNKCILTFSDKNELLQHESSVHQKKRYKNASSITDGVIIKDGKYECQFCHKIFSERHRYNGHVGTHVRYQAKMAGESSAGAKGESVDPVPCSEFPVQDTITRGSIGDDKAAEICNALITNRQNSSTPCSKADDLDVMEAKENAIVVDQPTEKITEGSSFSVAEILFSSNNNKSLQDVSDNANMNVCATEVDSSSLQGLTLGNLSPLPFNEKACGTVEGVVENSAPIEKSKQEAVSESSSLDSSSHVQTCDIMINNENACQARNELKLGDENFAVNESMFEFFGSHNDQDKDTTANEKQLNAFEDFSCENFGKKEDTSASGSVPNNVCLTGKYTTDEIYSSGTCEKAISEADNGAVNWQMEMQPGIGSAIPTWNEQNALPVFTSILEEPRMQSFNNRRLDALPSHESQSNYDYDAYGRKIKVSGFNGIRNSGIGGLNEPYSLSHTALNFNSTAGTEQNGKFGGGSTLTSTTDKQFFTEDNMFRVFGSALEEHNQEGSESVLFPQSGVPQFSNPGYLGDAMYPTSSNQPKLHEVVDASKSELSLSFGNFQREMHTGSSKLEPQRALGFGSSFKMLPEGRDWNGRGDKVGKFGQNIMTGFGNSSSRSGEGVIADGSWTTGQGDLFTGCFNAAPDPQVQSSSYFRGFDLTSDKGQESQPAINYGIRTDSLSTKRTDPVEYSFMGEQSSHSVPEESKIFPFTASSMEQGLDPAFWLGKDALMQNTAQSNPATSVCVWCRNEFYSDRVQPGMQTGEIGSLCPSCSRRIPGQFSRF